MSETLEEQGSAPRPIRATSLNQTKVAARPGISIV